MSLILRTVRRSRTRAAVVAICLATPLLHAQAGVQKLEGTAWNAVELAGVPPPASPTPARQPHVVFGADGRVSGADGCNRFSGPYTVKGEAISFGVVAGTRMACPGTEDTVRRFMGALKGTAHWRIENERLAFYGATGKPLAVFERRSTETKSPAAPKP